MANNLMQEFPDIQILKDEPLSKYTNTKTGGPADWLAFPKNVDEVEKLVQYADQNTMPLTVIGNASNLIVRDGGIEGMGFKLKATASLLRLGPHILRQPRRLAIIH